MNCSVEELFPNFAPDADTDSILETLKLSLARLNKFSTQLTLTQSQASLIVSNLSNLILVNETHKDIIIVSFLLIQRILNYVSQSIQQFLSNFIQISAHFGFQGTHELLSNNISQLQLTSPRNSNIFIKLIFLREFITGKDTTMLNFLFSPSFESSIIYQFFFKQLKILSNNSNFSNYIRVYCHTLIQWLDTAMLFFQQIPHDSNVNNDVFGYKTEISKFIFNFVWKFIEEPLPGISENAKIILQKYFRLYTRFSSWSKQDPAPFYQSFLNQTLAIPWTSKARYILLHVITEHTSSESITSQHGRLPHELTRCLSTTTLHSPASDLYKALIGGVSIDAWTQLWLAPFMTSLLSSDQNERHHLTQYWLPSTLKFVPTSSQLILTSLIQIANSSNSPHMRHITPLLTSDVNTCTINLTPNNDSILYATILWIKYSIVLDQFSLADTGTGILREGLSCGDEAVRVEALHVILTSVFDISQLWRLELIREFFPLNLNPPSTASRQKLSVIIYKSVACIQSLLIEGLPPDSSAESVDDFRLKFEGFIRILCLFKSKSLQCLWPDSPFQKVALALSIYQSLVESFVNPVETKKSNFKSKQSKLKLYNTLCNLGFELLTLSDLVPVCLCLTSDYFEIREMAFRIINPHLTLESVSQALRQSFPDGLCVRGKSLLTSSRVYDGETGALLLKLNLRSEVDNCRDTSPADRVYSLCLDLLSELSGQFVSAKKNILEAAHHAPLFSTITTINYILNTGIHIKTQEEIDWQGLLSDLIALLNDIITFSLSTLGDSNTDNEDVLAPSFADMGVAIESAVLATQSTNQTEQTSSHTDCSSISYQFVMNCVWLALRESNALLGALSVLPIINTPQAGHGKLALTPQLVDEIGSILIMILTKCRHIGALLSCQTALIKLCSNISCCAIPSVSSLPSKWLHDIMNTITSHDKKSSISRQGAGLPLCVQSILTSESKFPHKPLLHYAMHALFLQACNTELVTDASDTHDTVAVRCTNVLRALFRDSTVGNECVLFYGEKGLSLAISSMRSSIWSVRNAGMILFGALAVKMLGQRRLSEENSELNCITVRQFFTRFPSARSLLLSQLQSSPDCASTDLHAAVYPVLLMLSKLCPSPHYAFPEKLDYIHTLQCYVHSPVNSVRCKASQALTTFLYKPRMDTIILHLISKIPNSPTQCISFNVLHGQLVLISEVIKAAYVTYDTGCTDVLLDIQKQVMSHYWLLGNDVPLSINRIYFNLIRTLKDSDLANAFEIKHDIFNILSQYSYTDPNIIDFILTIIEYFQSCLPRTNEIFQQTFYNFYSEFLHHLMKSPIDSIIHLSTLLLKHANSIQWLSSNMNALPLELIKCFIQCTTSPLIPFDSLSSLIEVIGLILEVTQFDKTLGIALDTLIDTILNATSCLTAQLCSMQIAGIILVGKSEHQDVAVKREEEVKIFWIDLIKKHSKPDLSEDSRMTCVLSLVRILKRTPIPQYLQTILIECIDVVILLLQDELAEIRNALADGLATVFNATPPLHSHIVVKLLLQYVATHWFQLKPVWDVLLRFVTAGITMNDLMVNDEIVLFERGKDNVFGEDSVNFEFALKSLYIISKKLEDSNLNEDYIQSVCRCLEKELNDLPKIPQPNKLDSLFKKDGFLFKKISGIFCLTRLLSRMGREEPVCEDILQLPVHSYFISVSFRRIQEWIEEN